MRLMAPAKINLHLRVGPPARDGFHPLLSWMCTVSLFDTLVLSKRQNIAGSPLIQLSCDDPSLPCDASNLIVRASMVLAEEIIFQKNKERSTRKDGNMWVRESRSSRGTEGNVAAQDLAEVRVALQKRIPMGAGLGGGSADGATAMLGLSRLWGADLGSDRLAELSSRCGSDLPFFFHGKSSICTGRGEVVKPTPPPAPRWGVLVLPKIAMPTPAVYRKFDEMRLGDAGTLTDAPDFAAWATLPAADLLPRLVNDLEAPAFAICPELGALRSRLESQLGRPVRMSGSGSSLFTLFDDRAAADGAVSEILRKQRVHVVTVEIAPAIHDDLGTA